MIDKKINVDDLNGVGETNFKLITEVIESLDPVKFSELCKSKLEVIHSETIVFYGISTNMVMMQGQHAIVLIATIQYWATEKDFNQYLVNLKAKNSIIKP